jgi:DNA-binding transcriptional LysR family regulator
MRGCLPIHASGASRCALTRACLLLSRDHPLAKRSALTVSEVLDETFVRFPSGTDPVFAAIWSFDEHRAEMGPRLSAEHGEDAESRFQMIAAGLGVSRAPAYHAGLVERRPGVVALPITDADPIVISLYGHRDQDPAVNGLIAAARRRTQASPSESLVS